MVFLLCFLAFFPGALAQNPTPTFVPMLYVTPVQMEPKPDQIDTFHAALCDGSTYDGFQAVVSANLPNHPWSEDSQQLVYFTVYDKLSHEITNNTVTGQPLSEVSFPYQRAYGDLTVVVQAGNAGSIVYSLTIQFVSDSAKQTVSTPTHSRDLRSFSLATYELDQIVADSTTFAMDTDLDYPGALINLGYCPTSASYDITISVVAVDDVSAFATYACLASQAPCSAGKAAVDHSDPRGIPVNTVVLRTNTQEFTTLQIAVYGSGKYQGTNTALFFVNVAVHS